MSLPTAETRNLSLDALNGAGWLLLTDRERDELRRECRPPVENQTQAFGYPVTLRGFDSAVGDGGSVL